MEIMARRQPPSPKKIAESIRQTRQQIDPDGKLALSFGELATGELSNLPDPKAESIAAHDVVSGYLLADELPIDDRPPWAIAQFGVEMAANRVETHEAAGRYEEADQERDVLATAMSIRNELLLDAVGGAGQIIDTLLKRPEPSRKPGIVNELIDRLIGDLRLAHDGNMPKPSEVIDAWGRGRGKTPSKSQVLSRINALRLGRLAKPGE